LTRAYYALACISGRAVTPPATSSDDSSRKRALLKTPRKKLVKRPALEVSPTPVTTEFDASAPPPSRFQRQDFIKSVLPFNGTTCHFLKKASHQVFFIAAANMAITKTESVVIFNMDDYTRHDLRSAVYDLLVAYGRFDLKPVNPFELCFNDEQKQQPKPVFIRISAGCTYIKKIGDSVSQVIKSDRPQPGKCFSGTLAVMIKGVSMNPHAQRLSPIVNVAQMIVECKAEPEPPAKETEPTEEELSDFLPQVSDDSEEDDELIANMSLPGDDGYDGEYDRRFSRNTECYA
jgi:hypothetical protein